MMIVLSGEAGAGKDSAADILVNNHGFVKFSMAGPLKRFAGDMFGFTDEQLYGRSSFRNAPDPRWKLKCLVCGGTGNQRVYYHDPVAPDYAVTPCNKCGGTGKVELSPRSVLQPLGDEYLREMIHPDVLSIRASWDIKPLLDQGKQVVVTDARFSNDRDNFHEWFGAHRVDIRAPGKKNAVEAWRLHRSETDRPAENQVELVVENAEEWPFPTLHERVSMMLDVLRHLEAHR